MLAPSSGSRTTPDARISGRASSRSDGCCTATATTAPTAARASAPGKVIGTYVHGPLLPKNPWLADWLVREALEQRHGAVELDPLDDALELEAHRVAEAIAAAG